jgi:hypothetical protein
MAVPWYLAGIGINMAADPTFSQDSETESLLGRTGIDSRYVTLSPERRNKLNLGLYLVNKSPTYNE